MQLEIFQREKGCLVDGNDGAMKISGTREPTRRSGVFAARRSGLEKVCQSDCEARASQSREEKEANEAAKKH